MEQKMYDYDKLTKLIQSNIDKGLVIETNSNVMKVENDVTFNVDDANKLFHYFKFKNGKVYLFYVKKLLDKDGNVLLENNFCNINYSVYDIFFNVFGKDVARRYAKWSAIRDKEMESKSGMGLNF